MAVRCSVCCWRSFIKVSWSCYSRSFGIHSCNDCKRDTANSSWGCWKQVAKNKKKKGSLNCSCLFVLVLILFGCLVFCLSVYKLFKSRLVHFNFCGFLEVLPSSIANIPFLCGLQSAWSDCHEHFCRKFLPDFAFLWPKVSTFLVLLINCWLKSPKTWINFPMSAPGNCGGVQLAVAVVSMELHS